VVAALAFEPFVEWVPESNPKSWRRLAERQMSEWVTPLRALGVRVDTTIVEYIHPVGALAETAERRYAQLIVVGTHGRGGFPRTRLGGVALHLVHHARLPVVLVPHAHGQDVWLPAA
jgi:nucleotide-binding universal stress UspA family protein